MIRLDALRVRCVTRALAAPVGGLAHRTDERIALEVELEAEGLIGSGEAAPLPRYSLELLPEVEAALERWARTLPRVLPSSLVGIDSELADLPASARAALETAILDLRGRAERRPLWSLLCDREGLPAQLPLCASLLAPMAELTAEARGLAAAGYKTYKRKLALAELDLLASLPGGSLRLDANRGLDRGALRAARPRLRALALELLEEPVAGSVLEALEELEGLPVAIDESLAASRSEDALALLERHADALRTRRLRAVVLKPGRDGLLGALRLGERARGLGADVIVSHLWDGAIGHLAAAHLAFAIASPVAQGLAPHPGWGPEPSRARAALEACIDRGQLKRPERPGLGFAAHA